MTRYERYEIKAEVFRLMTGHMAPGKDAPSGSCPAPFEERAELFEQWIKDNHEIINAFMIAIDHVMDT